ncbi:MAG: hypothetical protein AAF577_13165 [Pseudomonadota bacterium]
MGTGLSRRAALIGAAMAGALAGGFAPPLSAHTPYRQWVVYRQKHLLIGAHRGDPRTYTIAKSLVAALAEELPDAKARVARGPRPQRIASLMGTAQMMIAVISDSEAAAMVASSAPFENYRPTPLRRLGVLRDGYGLYAIPDLPDEHAWMVADALTHAGLIRQPLPGAIAVHPGAEAYWHGEPVPG